MSEAYSEVIALRGKDLKYERNDCSVVALSKLTEMEYPKAHQLLLLSGRHHRRGVGIEGCLEFIKCNQVFLSMLGINVDGYSFRRCYATGLSVGFLRQNLDTYPGRYLVRIYGHCFAMINGKITDDCRDSAIVTGLWQFEIKKQNSESEESI